MFSSRYYKANQVKLARSFDAMADFERAMFKRAGIKDSELDLAMKISSTMSLAIYCGIGGHIDWAPNADREKIYQAAVDNCGKLARSSFKLPSNASPKLKELYKHYLDIRAQVIAELKRGGVDIKKPEPKPKPDPVKETEKEEEDKPKGDFDLDTILADLGLENIDKKTLLLVGVAIVVVYLIERK